MLLRFEKGLNGQNCFLRKNIPTKLSNPPFTLTLQCHLENSGLPSYDSIEGFLKDFEMK